MPVPIASTSLIPLVGWSVGAKDLVSFNKMLGRIVPENVVGLFDSIMPGLLLMVGESAFTVRYFLILGFGLASTTQEELMMVHHDPPKFAHKLA
jgi:hypothetical protein